MSHPVKQWKVNNQQIGPSGKSMFVLGSNEHLVKRGAATHRENKTKWGHLSPHRKMLRSMSENNARYPRYVFWTG